MHLSIEIIFSSWENSGSDGLKLGLVQWPVAVGSEVTGGCKEIRVMLILRFCPK